MPHYMLGHSALVVWRCVFLMRRMIFSLHCCGGNSVRWCFLSNTRDGVSIAKVTSSRETGHNSHSGATKTPSIIFFGGDIVSLVALKTLCQRLHTIAAATSFSAGAVFAGEPQNTTAVEREPKLLVVCPFVPGDHSVVSQRYHRQYPVARYCIEHGIPLLPVDHPTSLARSGTLRNLLNCSSISTMQERNGYVACQPLEAFDVAVVVSFRYFLPNKLLERLPRTINLHPSLLPRYRGASPIFAPLLRGDEVGGASVIKLLPHQRLMDSGDVLWQKSVPISPDMTIHEYFPLVTELGAMGLCECLFGKPPALSSDADWRAADASVCSVCDWPRSFDASWASAQPQNYDVQFTEDPHHASLLPKDRAIIRWRSVTAEEAYGTWRAFVGGEYFKPTVNSTLDKGATPVREQLLQRLRIRAAREMRKKRSYHSGHGEGSSKLLASDEKVSELVSHCVGSLQREKKLLEKEENIKSTLESQHHFYQHLLVSCTFTGAVHPKEVPTAVRQELQQLEKDGGVVIPHAAHHHHNHHSCFHHQRHHCVGDYIEPGSAYFPKAAKEMCAVKCREGWFVWQMAALKGSTSQPADLLRKGMAMKTGVLYVSLFVENDMGRTKYSVSEG